MEGSFGIGEQNYRILQPIQFTFVAVDMVLALARCDEADSSICLTQAKCKLTELLADSSRIQDTIGLQCPNSVNLLLYKRIHHIMSELSSIPKVPNTADKIPSQSFLMVEIVVL